MHQFGLALKDINWVQAGVNEPGRHEKVALKLPDGVTLTRRPDSSLNAMLLSGELDAVLSAHAPQSYEEGHPDIVRLFEDYRPVEEAYFTESGVFPIMHVIAIRSQVLDRFPWVAANIVKAFEQSKKLSMARLAEMTASRYPVPWMQDIFKQAQNRFGADPFPYGIEANRTTLETFLRYAHEQGVCHRLVAVEELFARSVQSSFRV